MSFSDSTFDLADLSSGSRLLSDTSDLRDARTKYARNAGPPNNTDLSLSDLSAPGRPEPRRPFTLIPKREPEPQLVDDSLVLDDDAGNDYSQDTDQLMQDASEEIDEEARAEAAARAREEQIQHDLFMIRKMNATFEVYHQALRTTRASRERMAEQITQTQALLNRYIQMMSRSEDIASMIFDERFQGGDADEETLERERIEAEEAARREAEERIRAERLERERIEREARELAEREARERADAERSTKSRGPARGSGVRGVRGTRASMRGAAVARGTGRGAAPTTSSRTTIPRPESATSTRTGTGSIPRGTYRSRG